jgi:AcrR family transcriptional regulator
MEFSETTSGAASTPLSEEVWHNLVPDSAQRVVAAAIESFSEFGFHGTTTRVLATRSNLSLGGIYVHFKSKLDLLEFIVRHAHEELANKMLEVNVIEDPTERLVALVKRHVYFHATRTTAAQVANIELHSLPHARRSDIMTTRSVIDGLLTTAVEDGIRKGDFQVDEVRPVVFAIISLSLGLTRWYHPNGELSPDELADAYARAVLSMVRGQSARARVDA